MSETTLIRKTYINDTTGQTLEKLGKINSTDLSNEVSGLLDTNKVMVSSNDSTPDYLFNKIAAGNNIDITELDNGDDETILIDGEGKLLCSSNDTTFDYLENKVLGSDYIDVMTENDSGNENLIIELKFDSLIGNHLGWVQDTIAAASTRADVTEFDAETTKLKPATGSQKNILFREDVSVPGSMGTLENIGSAQTMSSSDWDAVSGLQFVYIAEKNNWFNIKNNGTATNGDFKNIITGTGENIKFLSRALFSYDKDIESWLLLAYTKAQFIRRDSISGSAGTDIAVSANLPQAGYYFFDVFVHVQEIDGVDPANLDSPQQLTVKASGDPSGDDIGEVIGVDISVNYDSGISATTKTIGNSLQGSGIIDVQYDSNDDLIVYVNVTLPNGDAKTILDGYLHLRYVGDNIIDAI